ncbi:hypothetical protein [Veronia pacifica]|uniref:hypothetical protein n=1 Tax=Veronia pacifica TaxID=1080227 RepID=UPI001C2FE376|nr:hypothetical protein [Veronia pacifica]
MRIERVYELPSQILSLVNESEREGFRFLTRLKSDFDSRVNTFSKDGEALFAVFEANVLIAIGGINA